VSYTDRALCERCSAVLYNVTALQHCTLLGMTRRLSPRFTIPDSILPSHDRPHVTVSINKGHPEGGLRVPVRGLQVVQDSEEAGPSHPRAHCRAHAALHVQPLQA